VKESEVIAGGFLEGLVQMGGRARTTQGMRPLRRTGCGDVGEIGGAGSGRTTTPVSF
jgi:hypothetical protein